MASIYYTGKAVAVAQVSRVQVGAYDAATTYNLTVNGISVTTIAQGSAEATATALAAAWNASTHPYFTPITAAVDSSASPSVDITLTADEAGFPFTASASVSGGSGTMGSVSQDTEATGPYHWDNADNWDLGRDPDNGDTVYVTQVDAKLMWNLDTTGNSPTEQWTRLVVRGNAKIGLSFSGVATSADGDTVNTTAPEYRQQYLKAAITTVDIQESNAVNVAGGTGKCHIHNTSVSAAVMTVESTAQSSDDTTRPAVCFLADDADVDLYIRGARAGVGVAAGNPGETATLGTIFIDDDTAISQVYVSEGVTNTDVTVYGGFLEIDAAATMPSITCRGGETVIQGTQAVTALTVDTGATCISNTTGTIATLTQEEGSSVDFTRSGKSRTVTTYNFNGGERSQDANVLTITNDNRSGRISETIVAS